MSINGIGETDFKIQGMGSEAREFWGNKLSQVALQSPIRPDFKAILSQSVEVGSLNLDFDQVLLEGINRITRGDYFLMYTILTAAVNVFLFRYMKTPVVSVGSPCLKADTDRKSSNRLLPVINSVQEDATFRQLLLDTRTTLLTTYKFESFMADDLREELGYTDQEAWSHLYDVCVELTNIHERLINTTRNINFSFTAEEERLLVEISYNKGLYLQETIQYIASGVMGILEKALSSIDTTVGQLIKMLNKKDFLFISHCNSTKAEYPQDKCIHQLFEARVREKPDDIALVCGNESLTYQELNARANKLAHYLMSKNIKPNNTVGLFLDRSSEMIVGLLGVLKSGAAYVPIEPTYPRERVLSMLNTSKFSVLLTRESLLERLPNNDSTVICLDSDWEAISLEKGENPCDNVTVDNFAYVIFTSGSTGVPKAAAVHHQGWMNLVYWFSKEYKISREDKVLIISSFSFDITQRSIAMSLINGGELHLLNSQYYDPELITETIYSNQISLLNCSPSTFYPLIENKGEEAYEKIKSLRCLFLGGESISASRLSKWVESTHYKTTIANVYGAAECSDVSAAYTLKDFERYEKSSVPAGVPINNTQVYIMDEQLNIVPVCEVGEICLAGDGVGKGYINDSEMTTRKFVPNPFEQNGSAKLYRTGDLGRYLPDGNIEFLGRVDNQVKIRGFRVELGDIETIIRQHPEVKEAVVVDKEFGPGDQRLIACIVPENGTLAQSSNEKVNFINELRLFATEKLPGYMVPNHFISMEELPLNPNGKVDRKKLKGMELAEDSVAAEMEEDGLTPFERELTDIFEKVLNIKIGKDDNFFEKGGHSILATQIIGAINSNHSMNLSTADLYIAPTVSDLSNRIKKIKGQMSTV